MFGRKKIIKELEKRLMQADQKHEKYVHKKLREDMDAHTKRVQQEIDAKREELISKVPIGSEVCFLGMDVVVTNIYYDKGAYIYAYLYNRAGTFTPGTISAQAMVRIVEQREK